MSNAVQPVICFRPRVSLYDSSCPMFVAVIALGTIMVQGSFFLILGYVVSTSLSYTFDFTPCP